ncbi:MAG: class B sortase [Clostridia bacterium]|nr:class B sortase [Clostridia bacterium]
MQKPGTIDYQIISIYTVTPESYYTTTSFLSNSVYEDFINKIKSRSIYDFGVETSSSDHILTLSTCSNNSSHRTVIHAKKIDALK